MPFPVYDYSHWTSDSTKKEVPGCLLSAFCFSIWNSFDSRLYPQIHSLPLHYPKYHFLINCFPIASLLHVCFKIFSFHYLPNAAEILTQSNGKWISTIISPLNILFTLGCSGFPIPCPLLKIFSHNILPICHLLKTSQSYRHIPSVNLAPSN